jgi:peptidoglycan/xylan/chitin deacetylase (PgdA/CDA1 family)
LQPKPALGSAGFIDPHHIERFWKEQFSYCYEEYDSFVFPISIHPQVSGKPQVLMMHDRLIKWIKSHEGVEFVPFEEMAKRFQEGAFPGVTVQGGADL